MRYRNVVLADGPSGYWPLDETSGSSVYDLGSAGVTGTVSGTITMGAVPFPGGGRAPYFGGSDATTTKISIADNNAWSSNTQSWELWFRPSSTTFFDAFPNGWFFLFGKAGPNYEIYSAISAGTLIVQLATSTGSPLIFDFQPGKVVEGRWNHYCCTYNSGGSARLWLNGRLVSSTSSFGGSLSNTTTVLSIGGKQDAASGFFRGSIAHVAIYAGKELHPARIMAHYRAGLGQTQRSAFATRRVA